MTNIKGAHKVSDPRITDREHNTYTFVNGDLTTTSLYDAPNDFSVVNRISKTDIIYVPGTSLPSLEVTLMYSKADGTTVIKTITTTYSYDVDGNIENDTTIET